MIIVDSHVHIYDCFDLDVLLNGALKNFKQVAGEHQTTQPLTYILLLTEGEKEGWWTSVLERTESTGSRQCVLSKQWSCLYSEQTKSLTAFRKDAPQEQLNIVGGRQIITREKIEVLALFCNKNINQGIDLAETVKSVEKSGGIPVLPWGVGKWIGKRGKIIKQYIADYSGNNLFLGDNGGRPQFWSAPHLFDDAIKKGIHVLPGTDPLPIPSEANRIGSFGFYLNNVPPDNEAPVSFLKNILLSQKGPYGSFGQLQKNHLFFLNQLRLRI